MQDPHPSPDRAQSPEAASLTNDTPLHPKHPTLQCALDSGADDSLPLLSLHDPSDPDRAQVITRKQLREGAARYAHMLLAHGVRRGDRVLLLLQTGSAFVEALLGCMLAGATAVPLPSTFTFGSKRAQLDALAPIAASAQASALITSARVRDALPEATRLAPLLPRVYTPDDLAGLGPAQHLLPSCSPDQPAFIQYTSGTTGHPKGAVISQRALVSNAAAIAGALELGPQTIGASWLPLFHDMGLVGVLLTAILHPYQLHLLPPESFLFRPRRWLELMARTAATLTAAPNFAYELCVARAERLSELDLSALRCALTGAESVQLRTLERFARHTAAAGLSPQAFVPVYGLAEATLAVSFCALDTPVETRTSAQRAVASVGRPVAGTTCAICDASGRVLGQGETGEIVVRSASLTDGYFRDEAASVAALRDGRLHTGDLGFIEGGRLFVTGRKKDLIIKAGRNLHPEDIELAARAADASGLGGIAAVARESPESGTEEVVVFAETRERDRAARERLQRAIRGEVLAALGVKVEAVHLCRVGALPRTTSGKIKRGACIDKTMWGEP